MDGIIRKLDYNSLRVFLMDGLTRLFSSDSSSTALDLEKATVKEEDMVLPSWNMLLVDDDEQLCRETAEKPPAPPPLYRSSRMRK